MPLCDAAARPALSDPDEAARELADQEVVHRQRRLRDLDPHPVDVLSLSGPISKRVSA